jgi:hypothetical protein
LAITSGGDDRGSFEFGSDAVIHEIKQTLWLDTPKGEARAKFLIDTGDDGDLQWVCFYANGEIWTWLNYEVRVAKNITMGIRKDG